LDFSRLMRTSPFFSSARRCVRAADQRNPNLSPISRIVGGYPLFLTNSTRNSYTLCCFSVICFIYTYVYYFGEFVKRANTSFDPEVKKIQPPDSIITAYA